ncbi:MAG: hypothetical protein GEU80_17075 [Dehalococcoidia bacterium]|nr:hypothetical protein [Dehalococcoidia bacterium]
MFNAEEKKQHEARWLTRSLLRYVEAGHPVEIECDPRPGETFSDGRRGTLTVRFDPSQLWQFTGTVNEQR